MNDRAVLQAPLVDPYKYDQPWARRRREHIRALRTRICDKGRRAPVENLARP